MRKDSHVGLSNLGKPFLLSATTGSSEGPALSRDVVFVLQDQLGNMREAESVT